MSDQPLMVHEYWRDRALAAERREKALRKAVGSCLWVLDNVHNAGTYQWADYLNAAERDAREALAL